MEDKHGHRISPEGKRLVFDERCKDCKCPKLADIWEEVLNITPSHLRITLNVKKLRILVEELLAEAKRT